MGRLLNFSTDGRVVYHLPAVMFCHVMSCYVMSCHVMSCHVMSCYVMSCHVMSCYVMSCQGSVAANSCDDARAAD